MVNVVRSVSPPDHLPPKVNRQYNQRCILECTDGCICVCGGGGGGGGGGGVLVLSD